MYILRISILINTLKNRRCDANKPLRAQVSYPRSKRFAIASRGTPETTDREGINIYRQRCKSVVSRCHYVNMGKNGGRKKKKKNTAIDNKPFSNGKKCQSGEFLPFLQHTSGHVEKEQKNSKKNFCYFLPNTVIRSNGDPKIHE